MTKPTPEWLAEQAYRSELAFFNKYLKHYAYVRADSLAGKVLLTGVTEQVPGEKFEVCMTTAEEIVGKVTLPAGTTLSTAYEKGGSTGWTMSVLKDEKELGE